MTPCRDNPLYSVQIMSVRIVDIHTHKPAPQKEALVCVTPGSFTPLEGQWYSVGIHPWETKNEVAPAIWEALETAARNVEVKAVGECGIDKLKGGPLFIQMQVMKRQVELSELVGKPLVIHNVLAHDIIIGLKKDLNPVQPWLVHGFRGKPTVARMLTDAGMFISFGPLYNAATVAAMPEDMILAETDDSPTPIDDVIAALSEIRGKDMTGVVERNAARFLGVTQ